MVGGVKEGELKGWLEGEMYSPIICFLHFCGRIGRELIMKIQREEGMNEDEKKNEIMNKGIN